LVRKPDADLAMDAAACIGCGAFLFLQAEDGIRDGHVTGVQTCALPISTADRQPLSQRNIFHNLLKPVIWPDQFFCLRKNSFGKRSEERRVGKEFRSWRSPGP